MVYNAILYYNDLSLFCALFFINKYIISNI